jgi:cobaltochelatase CobS
MVRKFELIAPYLKMKKGTVFEATNVTDSIVTMLDGDGKKMLISRAFVKEVRTSVKTTAAPPPKVKPITPKTRSGKTTMSAAAASALSSSFGFNSDDGLPPQAPEPETKPEPEPKPKPIKLKKNEFFLSSMTDGRLPASGIDHIMYRHPATVWPDKTMVNDIPEIDKYFYWDADLLEAMWMAYILNKKMLMTGPPGTGKTTAAEQFCAWVRHPRMRFNGKDGIEASSFLGNVWVTKGNMEWKDGMMPQAVRLGYIILLDEVMKIPAGIQMALQNLYEENGYLTLDDKPGTAEDKIVKPHKNFRMFLTDNVKGTGDDFDKAAATQIQDTSTLDRFGITATVGYLPKAAEIGMLVKKYPNINTDEIKSLVTFAGLIRTGYMQGNISLTLSPRGLQTVCEILSHIPDVKRCLKMSFLDKIGDEEEIDAINEMVRTVY